FPTRRSSDLPVDEYAKKLINQGMILGMSAFVYRVDITPIVHSDNGVDVSEIFNYVSKRPILVSKSEVELLRRLKEYSLRYNKLKVKLSEEINSRFLVNQSAIGKVDLKIDFSRCIPLHVDVNLVNSDL